MKSVKSRGKTWYLTETRERNGRFTVYKGYCLADGYQERQSCAVLEIQSPALSDEFLTMDAKRAEGFQESFILEDTLYCVFSWREGTSLTAWTAAHWPEVFTMLKTLCLHYAVEKDKNPLFPWIFTVECGVVCQGRLFFNYDLKNDVLRLDCSQPESERCLQVMFQRIVEALPGPLKKDETFVALLADWNSLKTEAGAAMLLQRVSDLEETFEQKKEMLAKQLADESSGDGVKAGLLRKAAAAAVAVAVAAVLFSFVATHESPRDETAEPVFLWTEIGGMELDSQGRVMVKP